MVEFSFWFIYLLFFDWLVFGLFCVVDFWLVGYLCFFLSKRCLNSNSNG